MLQSKQLSLCGSDAPVRLLAFIYLGNMDMFIYLRNIRQVWFIADIHSNNIASTIQIFMKTCLAYDHCHFYRTN